MNIRSAIKKWERLGGTVEHKHSDLFLTHPHMPIPIVQSLCRKTANIHFQSWIRRLGKQKRTHSNGFDHDASRFRASVLERDQLVCLRCGRRNGQMDVHHLCPKGRGGSNHPGNGATLCSGGDGCHAWVHAHPTAATEEGWLSRLDPFKGVALPWADETDPRF